MKTVVALYDQLSDANAAVRDLVDYGLSRDNISLMANDISGNYTSYLSGKTESVAAEESIESTASGAAAGAGIGAIIGGLGGLLVGLGMLVIPGVGPVLAAGPLATAITALTGAGVGAMAGGAAGGLIGALVDLGLPEETAVNYAEGIRRGSILVTARTEDHQAEDVRRIMNRHGVVNMEQRVRGWRDQGWTGDDSTTEAQSNVGSSQYGAVSTSYDDRFVKEYDPGFRSHYSSAYANRGHNYDYYRPAYYFGYQLASDDRFHDRKWDEIEMDVRREWENQGKIRGAWEEFKDAVQHAWNRVTEGVEDAFNTTAESVDDAFDPPGTRAGLTETSEEVRSTPYTQEQPISAHAESQTVGTPYTESPADISGQPYDDRYTTQYDTGFQTHYTSVYGNRGHNYEYYRPAYYYGYQLANDDRYRDWDWVDLEPEARRDWEARDGVAGAWEDFKDAIYHSWLRVREGVRETLD